jgi:hypothetical protein
VETGGDGGSAGNQRGKRVPDGDIAPDRPRNRTEQRSRGSNGLAKFSGVELKEQAGNIDLAMVAKASL